MMHELYESCAGRGTKSVGKQDDLVRSEWLGRRCGAVTVTIDYDPRGGVRVIRGIFVKDGA